MRINKKYIKRCIEIKCHKLYLDELYSILRHNLISDFLKEESEKTSKTIDKNLERALSYISEKREDFMLLISKVKKEHLNKGCFYPEPFSYKNTLRMAAEAKWEEDTFEGRDFWLCPSCSEFYTLIYKMNPKLINFCNLLDFASRNITI